MTKPKHPLAYDNVSECLDLVRVVEILTQGFFSPHCCFI